MDKPTAELDDVDRSLHAQEILNRIFEVLGGLPASLGAVVEDRLFDYLQKRRLRRRS